MTELSQMQVDLTSYRKYTSDLKKVALWPKQLSPDEMQAIKEKVQADKRAAEQAEIQAQQEAAASTQRSKSTAKAKETPRAQSATSQSKPEAAESLI